MPLRVPPSRPKRASMTVAELTKDLKELVNIDISLCTDESRCQAKQITECTLHRPGLALAGFVETFTHQRIQILGNTEIEYLLHLPKEESRDRFKHVCSFESPAIILTSGNELPADLLHEADLQGIPVLSTKLETTRFMSILQDYMDDQFADQTMIHGSMVDVYGIGLLIAGKSGIGKSEVAMDLVERGHRLVSDDVVMLTRKNSVIMTSATEMNKHFMEIRGLGVVDVLSMFGIRSIRYQKRLEVVVELNLWDDEQKVERTGLTNETVDLMGISLPLIRVPMTPGKNITVIAEVIAMNHLLKHYGYDAAKAFQAKVQTQIERKMNGESIESAPTAGRPGSAISYFEGDVE